MAFKTYAVYKRLKPPFYLIDSNKIIFSGMCFATVSLTITNPGAVTMHHHKDTQKEIIAIEAAAWTFCLVVLLGIGYLLAKVTF